MNPNQTFTLVRSFTALIVPGDKWRLTASGNTLEVFQNGQSLFVYTTDGSYPTGDVGIEALTPNFTFTAWEGGDTAGPPAPTDPSVLNAIPVSGSQINLIWTPATDGAITSFLVERCQGAGCTPFAQIAAVAGTTYNDTALAANTSYSYRVRGVDAAGNRSPYSNIASATTLPF